MATIRLPVTVGLPVAVRQVQYLPFKEPWLLLLPYSISIIIQDLF
jgi:hypothetical protein